MIWSDEGAKVGDFSGILSGDITVIDGESGAVSTMAANSLAYSEIPIICLGTPAPANLLLNPGFEDGAASWVNATGTGRSIDTTASQSGVQSLKITASASSGRNAYQQVTITGGVSYQVSGWIKTSGLSANALIKNMVALRRIP